MDQSLMVLSEEQVTRQEGGRTPAPSSEERAGYNYSDGVGVAEKI